jgi:hypothetical protein
MNQPMPVPADEPSKIIEVQFTQRPPIGVQSMGSWPCGQDPRPRPSATDGATRATRREAGIPVLTAGPVLCFYGRYPTGPVASSESD